MRKFDTETVSVNLVAAADVVFLLLLFLMFSTDLSQRGISKSQEFRPPKVTIMEETPKAEDTTSQTILIEHISDIPCDDFLKGNVCSNLNHWVIKHYGAIVKTDEELFQRLKKLATLGGSKNKDISENEIIITADKRTPYQKIAEVMKLIAKAKIYKVKAYVEQQYKSY
jgi:biopolymer transport protein ExbD